VCTTQPLWKMGSDRISSFRRRISARPGMKIRVINIDEYRLDYDLIKRLLLKIATAPEMAHYSKAILIFMPGLAEAFSWSSLAMEE
jgi:hypothetical protein